MNSLVRTCQTPGAMFLEGEFFRRFALYIYVPQTTANFLISIHDQKDQSLDEEPSSFKLTSPNGHHISLDKPLQNDWSEYYIDTKGDWGVWQLKVEANSPGCQNNFLVKTVGEVDLYAKPDSCVSYRGALSFTTPNTTSKALHEFTLQVPDLQRLRINFQLPSATITGREGITVELVPPNHADVHQQWCGIERDRFHPWEFWRAEYLESTGSGLEGLWTLKLHNVHGMYHLGVEQDVRFFFTDTPLMPAPNKINVKTVDSHGSPIAARVELTSPVTDMEQYSGFVGTNTPNVIFTDTNGASDAFILPKIDYELKVSRGLEFSTTIEEFPSTNRSVTIPIHKKISPKGGWYGGDCHAHSMYSDGSFTPVQVVEAARGEGLSWIVLSDHGSGFDATPVHKAHKEGLQLSKPGKFIVIPGEEFSSDSFHANIFNGTVGALASQTLQEVIDAANKLDTASHPIAMAWNHPNSYGKNLSGTNLKDLPLVELWNNDPESYTTHLWWDWLNQGKRVFAETGTDSHHRAANPYGAQRTYVYLDHAELTSNNVVTALKEGKSFLSRGALLYFYVNGSLPGSTIQSGTIEIQIEMESSLPIHLIEIIGNGDVVRTINVEMKKQFDTKLTIEDAEGWYLVQVISSEEASNPIAMSNPVFVL